ncbi:MAG: ABC transporter substrate-binding protein [Betaproteobacteria bacterium]|jgi:NitT/TauT family transport system substrate-binding protein|nr:ABC transporter substrate-binding protein [Rhodocyclaceae bacterium]MCE2897083.1 ABC transporter substrate-binding protein [Betaproteobacteria bacterium]
MRPATKHRVLGSFFTSFSFKGALGALFFCLASATALAAGSARIGTVIWIGYGPFYVADQLDLFKKSGVKVTMQVFTDPALIPPAVTGGSVDGGMITYDQVVSSVAKGSTMRVVQPIDYSNGGDAIVAAVDVKSVKDLKGQKVAFNPLSPSDFLLSYALQSNGLSEKDVKPVNMSPEGVPAAMASGSVKVGVTYEPSVSEITAMGGGGKFKVLYSSKDAPGLITDVLVFKSEYIKKNPEVVKALIQGYVDGLDYMSRNPAEAAKLIGKVMGISAKEVLEQLPAVYNPTLAEFPKVFDMSKETTSLHTSGAVIAKILKAKGEIKAIPRTEDTYDDSVARSMMKK